MSAGSWSAVGATVRGSGHRTIGCQDAHRVELQAGRLVIAVADGAGSAPLAATGAALAVDRAVAAVLEAPGGAPAEVATSATRVARAALDDAAAVRGCPVTHLATTLLVVIVDDDSLTSAQVGDGAVVTRGSAGLSLVDPPERGEYLNETTFLTSGRWAESMRVSTTPVAGIEGLAVMSDGLQILALDLADDRPHGGFFEPLWGWLARCDDLGAAGRELNDFLASERVQSRADDDLTLVVATRRSVAAAA